MTKQLLADLSNMAKAHPLTPMEKLNCELTRAIDNSPCSYEEVIELLNRQLRFMREARRDEHGGK